MSMTNGRWTAAALAAVLAGGALLAGSRDARAQGAQIGELGAGGAAQGDISKDAGEEDRIGIDLAAGSTLDVKLAAAFAADVALLGPSDAPTGADFGAAATKTLAAWPVAATGKYHIVIRSADGSQGLYTLTAVAKWPTKVTLTGATGDTVSVGLPAGAAVKGTVSSLPGGSWDPRVMSFAAPGGANLLAAPVNGAKGVARLPKTTTSVAGLHSITVEGGTAGGQFQAAITVKAKKVKPVKLDLRNGLTVVGFAADGIGQIMKDNNCVSCHAWAANYAGVKQFAKRSLPRMQTGQMPVGGPRVAAESVSLFREWIATGMNQ
jgi:hypothetical protein